MTSSYEFMHYFPSENGSLEYIQPHTERIKEGSIYVSTSEPRREVLCIASLAHQYHALGRLELNHALSARYFIAAHEKGLWKAAFYLGERCRYGKGVEQNYE